MLHHISMVKVRKSVDGDFVTVDYLRLRQNRIRVLCSSFMIQTVQFLV